MEQQRHAPQSNETTRKKNDVITKKPAGKIAKKPASNKGAKKPAAQKSTMAKKPTTRTNGKS